MNATEYIVEKVTIFITRPATSGIDLLLIEHPTAGIQIPAGTVEIDEEPQAAAMREAREETGLTTLRLQGYLGNRLEKLPPGKCLIYQDTTV